MIGIQHNQKSLRKVSMETLRRPTLPSVSSRVIHPSLRGNHPRERGAYWWTMYQLKLEDEVMEGTRVLEDGTFYVFLEEECTWGKTAAVVRYGNVFMADHWDARITVNPKGEDDAQSIVNVMEEWRKTL